MKKRKEIKEMLINVQPDECRIAVVVDGVLDELYVEEASSVSKVGNIYKGRVTNIEPSIQAAFIDFGEGKNGFLHISDLHPKFFPAGQNHVEAVGNKRAKKDRPPIQSCLHKGDEIVVQVTRDSIGTKGATLTTYLSIPGRYLVLMPSMKRLGVSRKIEDEQARARARKILNELHPPTDVGFIVRTAGVGRSKQDLYRDMQYLLRLWEDIKKRAKQVQAPAVIYRESDFTIRTIRDVYNSEIKRIICDDMNVACTVKEFLRLIMPRSTSRVELYQGNIDLFHAFGIESEIEKINSPQVDLPSGGSIVIEQTEALVAIDVNSAHFRETSDAGTTALKVNSEAAREIARQLRLRDLGGVIIIDFIDMSEEKHRREVEKILREAVKSDHAKTKILRMSQLGIIEMTRQRIKPSLSSSISRPCPYCKGTGRIRSESSQSLSIIRTLRLASNDHRVANIELSIAPSVAEYIINHHRESIHQIEQSTGTKIFIHTNPELKVDDVNLTCFDEQGTTIQWTAESALTCQPTEILTREITLAELKKQKSLQAAEKQPQTKTEKEKPVPKAKTTRKRTKTTKQVKPSRKTTPRKKPTSDKSTTKTKSAKRIPRQRKTTQGG